MSFVLGLITAFFLSAVTIGFPVFADVSSPKETSKFEVVDKYQQCDVVRYTDNSQRWHHFLDCR